MAKRKKQGAYMISAVVVTVMLSGCGDSLCANEVVSEHVSPDRTGKVVVFVRDCGATTRFSTQGSLLRVGSTLPNEGGNLFVCPEKVDDIEVEWQNTRRVVIRHSPDTEFLLQRERVGDIHAGFVTSRLEEK